MSIPKSIIPIINFLKDDRNLKRKKPSEPPIGVAGDICLRYFGCWCPLGISKLSKKNKMTPGAEWSFTKRALKQFGYDNLLKFIDWWDWMTDPIKAHNLIFGAKK